MAIGTASSLGATIVTRVAAVVNSVLVVRALGVTDVGVFAIIGLIIAVASITSTAGVPPALVKFLAERDRRFLADSGELLGAGFVLIAIAATLTTVLLILFASASAAAVYGDSRIAGLIVVGTVGSAIGSLSAPFFATFQGFEHIKEMNLREVVVSAASIPTTYILVQQFAILGAVLVGIATGVISIATKAPLLRRIWRERRIRLALPHGGKLYRRILGFAIPAFASTLMISPILWLVESMLATEWNFNALGEYSVAYALAGYILLISGAIGVPMVPVVSRLDHEAPTQIAEFLVKTFRITAFLTLPPSIILIAYPVPFFRILYGPQYASAASFVTLLGPAMILASLSGVIGFAIAGVGKMWDGFLLNVLWGVSIVLLSLWLVPSYGGVGLASAFLGAYLIHFIGVIIYARSTWGVGLGSFTVPIAFSTIAVIVSVVAFGLPRPWNLIVALAAAGLISAGEYRFMSNREREVILMPLRMVMKWLERTP